MTIKGLSDKRRLPRAGKIRLGVLVQDPGKQPYPRATDYFVCPPEVQAVLHEDKPKVLSIVFPSDDVEVLFPQSYKYYRKGSGLWCSGDGVTARRWNDQGGLEERGCPCDFLTEQNGKPAPCKPMATLNFFMPDVPGIGVYQIAMSNKASIISLNSGLEMFSRIFGGLRGVPFLLRLEPQQVPRWDESRKAMTKTTLQVLRLDSDRSLRDISLWRQKVADVPALLMPEEEEPDALERAVGESHEAGVDPKQTLLDTIWTHYFDAAGGDATKAGAFSVKSVKQILGLDVTGLADLTVEQLTALSEKLYAD